MDTFWGLMGYLPLLILGLLGYWLFRVVPRRSRPKVEDREPEMRSAGSGASDGSEVQPRRRRALVPAASLEGGEGQWPSSVQAPVRNEPLPITERPGPTGSLAEPQAVSETVTVVLRRQVPPRFEEPDRSWLGGLPRLPEGVEWPRSVSSERPEQGERPLHFLAQICCADLPADLWGGLGPREGWLLLFIDPNQGSPEDRDSFRVIHIPQLGPEREAPFDLGPVHDGVYTGGSYRWLPADQIPPVWRRWPVDIVSFPNVLHQVEGRSFATPEGFAETLYEGAAITPGRELKAVRPYRIGQAIRAVRTLAARMRAEPGSVTNEYSNELLQAEDSLSQLRGHLAAQAEAAAERQESAYRTERIEGLSRTLALVDSCPTPPELVERLEQARERHIQWRTAVAEDCEKIAGLLEALPPETPLSLTDWEDLQASLDGKEWRAFDLRIEYPTGQPKHLDLRERLERVSLEIPSGTTEEALVDWLDSATRAQVPIDRLDDLEAAARNLTSNRPHRMGGYHDGVQSDAVEGPASELLLFQIASDDAMDWCWGDVGAYYFWIRPAHLAAGDFSGVEMQLECH